MTSERSTEILRSLATDMSPIFHGVFAPFKQLDKIVTEEGFYERLDAEYGDVRKIGVFGPYRPTYAREIIDRLCVYIARKGYMVFSGNSYYHPSLPEIRYSLDTIFSDRLTEIFNDPANEEFLFTFLIPAIIEKAVCRVAPLRTQLKEITGCEVLSKPVLGFANHEHVAPVNDECDWVDVQSNSEGTTKICRVNHYKSCPKDQGRDSHCIFYLPHEIPRIEKTRFLKNNWLFYSLNDYERVFPLIDNFLQV